MDTWGKVQSKSIKDSLCELIRDAIIRGDLKPGERIVEQDLSEKFNTSRTPLREAMQILETEKLVTRVSNRGVFISSISEREINEIYDIRLLLEQRVIEQVALNYKPEQLFELEKIVKELKLVLENKPTSTLNIVQLGDMFHMELFKIYNNREIIRIYEQLQNRIKRYAYIALNIDAERHQKSAREHIAIFDSIMARDSGEAKRRMEEHIILAQKITMAKLKSMLDGGK